MNFDLKEDGFTILKNVFQENELQEVRNLTNSISKYADNQFEDPFEKYYLGHRNDQGALYDLYQRHPQFQFMVKNDVILDELEKVLGTSIFMYENCLVYKPQGKANAVPWHQDFINRKNEPVKYIVWIALDDVTIENGAMFVVPGSHKKGFLPWKRVKGETHHDQIITDGIDLSQKIQPTMKAGDVLIFNQLLLHSSEEVNVQSPRRAFRISYQGFGQIFTPRGAPIVMRGGEPEKLEQLFNKPKKELTTFQIYAHELGRKLLKL